MLRTFSFFLRFLTLAVALFAGLATRGQSVRWEPGSGTLARDQVSQLTLIFQDCEPKETPVPPAVDGLTFEPNPGRTEQSNFSVTLGSRGVRKSVVTYIYRVRPTRPDGEVRIPAFTIASDAGALTVPAAGFTLSSATVGQSGLPLDKIASARFTPPASRIWAGEVFRLTHTLDVDRRYVTNSILASALDWTPASLIAEDWSKPSGTETLVNGQARILISNETRVIAPSATASLPIPPATQLVNLPTGNGSALSMFPQATFEQFTITSAPATLQIRPLPSPAPKDFNGAVGQFTLTGKIIPEKVAVGEPITWTLTLTGTGNWPVIDRLPARELSRDFRIVSPRAQKTPKENSLFDASLTEDLVLIPQKPGRTTLGPYTLSVFNPSTGAYETLRTEPVVIDIAPGATPAEIPNSKSQIPGSDQNSAPSDSQASGPGPQPSSPLPSDPLPAGVAAAPPLDNWPRVLLWTLPALLVPAALWLGFAARHARVHDPLRPRREAHARLNSIIARLETSSPVATADLLAWQHATRELFNLKSATPSARDLADPVWIALWLESERALYRQSTPLAPDWLAQARDALVRATPPAPSAFAALRPAHLFPRLAVLLAGVLSLAAPNDARAAGLAADAKSDAPAEASAAYAKGDFALAEIKWRDAVKTSPLDSAHRHNLALALAQQGKWDEAAAQAYAASLQAPHSPEARRLLDVTLPKASFRVRQTPSPALLFTSRGWQYAALAAAVLLLLAPTAYLVFRYTGRRGFLGVGHGAVLLAVAGLATAFLALRAYGPAAHPATIIVWRDATLRAVPTDAGDQKITSPLPAGTLAGIDKAFLGWRRLILADGTTGWVRVEPLVGLWRTP